MIKVRFKRAVTVNGFGSFHAGEVAELSKEEIAKLGPFIEVLEKEMKPKIEPAFKPRKEKIEDEIELDNNSFYKRKYKGE